MAPGAVEWSPATLLREGVVVLPPSPHQRRSAGPSTVIGTILIRIRDEKVRNDPDYRSLSIQRIWLRFAGLSEIGVCPARSTGMATKPDVFWARLHTLTY
jgi:hypothetical protein